jgi:hypothetical protein
MKTTQAWGWLVAGVLAAGLNASYQDGGLQWAHQIADQVEHSSKTVLALASGHADQFLTEGQLVTDRDEPASCPLSTAWTRLQTRLARSESEFARVHRVSDRMSDRMSAREQVQLARLQANRDRMEARIEAQAARIRIPAVAFDSAVVNPVIVNPVIVRVPQVSVCPRIRVSVPRPPRLAVPAMPTIHIDSGSGPI